MTFITVAQVRYSSGAPVALISNTAVEHAISIVENETSRKMNTKFIPTRRVDIMDGTGNNYFFTEKNPCLKIVDLKSDGDDIDPTYVDINKSSGMIRLNTDADTNTFVAKQQSIAVDYYFGMLDPDDDNRTVTTSAVIAGSSIVVSVDDAGTIAADDWIEIVGTDTNREIAKVTAVSTNDITVDSLQYDHVSGSLFYKIHIPYHIKRFMELEASIYVALNAIGATYTFNASYSLGDLSVVKGVPYTHWRESVQRCVQERETLRKLIKPRPCVVVN